MSFKNKSCTLIHSYVFHFLSMSSSTIFLSFRGPLETIFYHWRAFGPARKKPFCDHWETAILDQILARSFLEAIFCHLRAFGPAIKISFWDHWETALLGQILARSLLEAIFCHLKAFGTAIKNTLLGPLGNSSFGPNKS